MKKKESSFRGNVPWSVKLQKNIYFCFIDYAKAFDCVDHNKLRKILKEMGLGGSQAPRRAVCGTRGSLRTMHRIFRSLL